MRSFAYHNVGLFIFYLIQEIVEFLDCWGNKIESAKVSPKQTGGTQMVSLCSMEHQSINISSRVNLST